MTLKSRVARIEKRLEAEYPQKGSPVIVTKEAEAMQKRFDNGEFGRYGGPILWIHQESMQLEAKASGQPC